MTKDDLISRQPETHEERTETHACDLIDRVFKGIVVEYPTYSTYPEYEGKPYFSIKYTENGQEFIGYGTFKPEVLSEYLKEYFIPSAQPQRWIPCSERLPEDGKKHYWVCTDTGCQCECRWTNINHFWTDLTTNWHWHIMDIPQYSAVIAWMPLPEPWKEGETDESD